MSGSKLKRIFTKSIIVYLSLALSLLIPLDSLTVYAQTTDPNAGDLNNTDTPAQEEPEGNQDSVTLDQLQQTEQAAVETAGVMASTGGTEESGYDTHTFLSGSYVNNPDTPLGVSIVGGDTAYDSDTGIYYVPNPAPVDYSANTDTASGSTNATLASFSSSYADVAADGSSDTGTSDTSNSDTGAAPVQDWPFFSPFWGAATRMHNKLSVSDLYGNRLAISEDDLVALIGENGGTCVGWQDPEDDYFVNHTCDTPRADRRIITMLDYLLRPRSEGGAGREYIKVSKIVQFTEPYDEADYSGTDTYGEPVTNDVNRNGRYDAPTADTPADQREGYIDLNGNNKWDETLTTTSIADIKEGSSISPHYVDLTATPTYKIENGVKVNVVNDKSNAASNAVDISEIDRLRITTRIVRKGLFSKSTKYKYQKPINIKVAWQSEDGIAAHPLPEVSVQELIKDLSVNSILEMLDADGILGDFDFQGRSIDTLSTEDLAKFVGGRLLSTLLDGADISNFNFGDVMRDFGAIVLAGSFNVDVNAIKNANSIADIEEYTGRADVSKKVGLTGLIEGKTQEEVFQSIGRQRFADLIGIKAYALANYSGVDGFKEAIGWGRIEQRLPVPEKSFQSNNLNEVKAAVKDNRYNVIFTANNASIIAERLQITTDQVNSFIQSGNVQQFKRDVGEVVWKNNIDRYKVNNYIPQHPACTTLQVAGTSDDSGGRAEGSLYTALHSLDTTPGTPSDSNFDQYQSRINEIIGQVRQAGNVPVNSSSYYVVAQDSLTTQCGYTDATFNQNARTSFLNTYNNGSGGIASKLETLINDLNGEKSVTVDNKVQTDPVNSDPEGTDRQRQVYAAVESLDSANKTLTEYATYDRNPDGTGQQRDKAFNMPAGVTYDIIGGGARGQAAFKNAGIWYLSQRLPNSQQRDFRAAANSTTEEGRDAFVPVNPSHEFFRDVFLTDSPAHEFRRIGRRLLITRLQNSPNATALKQTDIVSDALFYFNRYQTIRTSLEIIRNNLSSLPADVRNDVQGKIDGVMGLVDGAEQAYQAHQSSADSMAARRIVRDIRGNLYQLIDTVNKTDTLKNINEVLAASRDLERAVMEILEGNTVAYPDNIPTDLEVPETSSTVNGAGKGTINGIIGTDDLVVRAGFQLISGQYSLQDVMVQLGVAKLSRLFELPSDALLEYHNGDDKSTDGFFAAVGRGRRMQQHQNPANDRDVEIREGKEYVTRYTIPGLARKLNIEFPDWMQPEDIAEFVMGNTVKALVGMGGRQIEHALDLPKNFITDVVYPAGNTDALRNENRQHTLINAVLKKLDLNLALPDGFVLDSNPVVSMGAARIEGALGWDRGEFSGTRQEILDKVGYSRFMSSIGLRIPLAAVLEKQNLDKYQSQIVKIIKDTGWGTPCSALPKNNDPYAAFDKCLDSIPPIASEERQAFNDSRTRYNDILKQEMDNIFQGTPLYGSDSSDQRQKNDADSRLNLFNLKMQSIDKQLNVDDINTTHTIGTTQKWLEGAISTDQFAIEAGQKGALLFGSDAFAAALTKLGVDGQVYDTLIGNTTNRHFLVNFFQQTSYSKQDFAQMFNLLSKAFSVNLDKACGFEAGTFARLITEKDTDDILFDQGTRLLSKKYLHIDLSYDTAHYDQTINIKRVMQRAIFGAAYNSETHLFEFDSANPYRGLIEAVRELNDMSLQYIQDQIGNDLFRYLKAPLNSLFAIVDLNIRALEEGDQVVSIAQAMRQATQDNSRITNDTLKNIAAEAQAIRVLSLNDSGGQTKVENDKIAGATATGSTANTGNGDQEENAAYDTIAESQLDDTASGYTENDEPPAQLANTNLGTINNPPSNNSANLTLASAKLNEAGRKELTLENIQMVNQAAWKVLKKEFAFALADFGLSKLIGDDIVAPGLTKKLIDGTAADRTNAIAYVASNVLVKNFGGPGSDLEQAGLGWLIKTDTIESFLNLVQGHGQDFANILTSEGIGRLTRLENQLLRINFFQYAGLKTGTLAGLFGYAITGKFASTELFGVKIKGLSEIYNTDWILGRVFFAAEKLTGIPAGKFAQMYFLGKAFYKGYVAWQAEKAQQAISGVKDTAKLAKLKAQWVNAAIQLGLFVVDLIFGKELAKFETQLGLPPGTILQAVGIILTGLLIGTGPMFFVTLGLFIIFTLFGFGFTRITTRATADGYYPFVGKRGSSSVPYDPSSGNIPYAQWPSADVLNNFGRVAGKGSGEFDPTVESEKIQGFKDAARGKVIGLINDLFEAAGRPGNIGTAQYGGDVQRDYPHQIFIHQIKEQPDPANLDRNFQGKDANLYLSDIRYSSVIKRINNQFFPGACNGGQVNSSGGRAEDPNAWGICTDKSYRDVVHISF